MDSEIIGSEVGLLGDHFWYEKGLSLKFQNSSFQERASPDDVARWECYAVFSKICSICVCWLLMFIMGIASMNAFCILNFEQRTTIL